MTDSVSRARRYVEKHFPKAGAAFLGGSAAAGAATDSSDLDVLVVLPEAHADVSFVETTRYEGQLVEAFCYGPAALENWLEKGRRERRPVLDRLIGDGIALTDSDESRLLQVAAREVLLAGPASLSSEEQGLRAYSLSAVLDDLVDATDPGERFILSATAWREAAELALLVDRRWLGNGKWLLRELRLQPDRFGLAAWASTGQQELTTLTAACRSVLEASGGYLQEGYVRGKRPADV